MPLNRPSGYSSEILQLGTPDELEAAPNCPFVFQFLAPTITLHGAVADGAFHATDLPVPPFPVTAPPGAASLLLRSHQLELVHGGTDAAILLVRHAGPVTHLTIEVAGRVLEVVASVAPFAAGERCGLRVLDGKVFAG